LRAVYGQLYGQGVDLQGTLLKPNMVLSGKECPDQAGVDEVAAATIECLRQAVPASVPGIVFLSGGQSSELATAHLNAMNALGDQPWELSFSYGRALQEHALKAWGGDAGNASLAQQAFRHRAECNGAARNGSYAEAMEEAV
jgi:fructose-bisphosphate aldolase class I